MSYLDKLKSKIASGDNNADIKTKEAVSSVVSRNDDVSPSNEGGAPKSTINEPKEEITKPTILKEETKQFFLSQTLIKRITDQNGNYKEVCPRQIYEEFILGKYKHTTLPMLEGIYGETLCLGGGARGQKVVDLPRHKKNGEKLTAQLNIEEQARRFPFLCNQYGMSIIPGVNTQVPIVKMFGKNRYIRTEIDIFPSPFLFEDNFGLSVIDLKFTSDVNSTFGDFGWGAPEYLDHCQADITYWLLQDFDMELNIKHFPHKEQVYRSVFENPTIKKMIENEDISFLYFILGYKKQPLEEQVKIIKRGYRDDNGSLFRQKELQERIRKTYAQLNEWALSGWPPQEGDRCFKCLVNKANGGYCDKAPQIKSV